MTLVSLISYLDRNALAILAPVILDANGLTAEQYGWIISAFSVTYMLANPLWGRWLDRYGVRWGMLAAVLLWTAASTAHAWVAGFWGFVAARGALGFGEGATFPGGLRTVVQTLPERWRARGVAVAYSGGSLGAVIAPLVINPIFNWFGWRAAFLFTGFIGLAWACAWLRVSARDSLSAPSPTPHAAHRIDWRDLRLWSFVATYALGCLPLAFVIYGSSLFLSRVWHRSQSEVGAVLWIPPLGWEVGYFVGAYILDRFGRPFRTLTLAAFLLIVPLALIPYVSSYTLVLLLFFWSMFVAGSNVVTAIGYATGVFGSEQAGFLAGLGAGTWSAAVALLMPGFGALFDAGSWNSAFALATAVSMLGTGLWLFLNIYCFRPRAI